MVILKSMSRGSTPPSKAPTLLDTVSSSISTPAPSVLYTLSSRLTEFRPYNRNESCTRAARRHFQRNRCLLYYQQIGDVVCTERQSFEFAQ